MKLAAMKPTINKSRLMKRAWTIYRNSRKLIFGVKNTPVTFSYALTRAWAIEKANAAVAIQTTHTSRQSGVWNPSPEMQASIANWYETAPAGTYFGD